MPPDPTTERPVDADSIATKTFDTAFRGFDQTEVREYLTAISATLRQLSTEQDALLLRLSVAEQRAVPTAELDPSQLTQMLGEETARVLETALTSAEQIRGKADEHASTVLTAANREAAATRTAADEYAATVTEQSDAASRTVREEAETYATELRSSAESESESARKAADEYAADVRQRADNEAEATRSAADQYAQETRQQADEEHHRKRDDADTYAKEVKERADAEAATTRSEADTYAVGVRQRADAEGRQADEQSAADAAATRAAAEADAQQMREEASQVLGERTQQAEAAAAEIRAEADAIRVKAADDADAELDRARTRGEKLLAEARAQRDEVNQEIARRRRASRAQLEQVSAARERLLAAYTTVRQLADEATSELDRARPEARAAAEAVARRAAIEEDELQVAKTEVTSGPDDSEADAQAGADTASVEAEERDVAGSEPGGTPVEPGLIESDPTTDADPASAAAAVAGVEQPPANGSGSVPSGEGAAADPPSPGENEPDAGLIAASIVSEQAAPADADAKPAKKHRLFGRHKQTEPEPRQDHPVAEPADVEALFARIRAGRDEGDETGTGTGAAVPEPQGRTDEAEDLTDPPSDGIASEEEAAEARIRGPFGLIDSGPPAPPEGAATDTEAATPDEAEAEPMEAGSGGVTAPHSVAAEVGDSGAETSQDVVAVGVVEGSRAATLFERRAGITDPIERKLDRKLKRALSDEQNTVLDAARRARDASFADLIPELDRHKLMYSEPARQDLAAAADAGQRYQDELAAESGTPIPAGQRPAPDLAQLAEDLAAELVLPLRERIESCFVEADGDEFELTDRVRACYREWKAQRLPDAARDYVLTAFAKGAYAAAPKGTPLLWVAETGDPAACPDCEDNSLAGAQAKGEPFPTGHRHPPAHPGCRCLLGPPTAVS